MTRRSILILPVATLFAACSTDDVRVTGVPDQSSRAVTPISPNGYTAGSILANISPTYPGTWASAINGRGDVAGGTKLNGVTMPYARRDGVNSRLTTRPDVSGTGITPAGSVILSSGEYWLRSGAITRPHPTNFYPVKVSPSGRIVGYSSAVVNGAELRTATTRHAGTVVSLRTALEASSEAIDVTSCGSVLARATAPSGTITGMLWTKATCDVAAPIP